MRYHEAARPPVLGRQRRFVVLESKKDAVGVQVGEQNVRGIALLRVYHRRHCLRPQLHAGEDLAHGDTPPEVVETAPPCDAVDVGLDLDLWQPRKLLPSPGDILLHMSEAAERPGAEVDARSGPV